MNNLYSHFKNNLKKIILSTENSHFSFNDLNIFTAKLVHCLTEFDLKPGDRVVALIEKSEFNVLLYLACLRAGFIYVPLNNASTSGELDYFFADAEPKIIVCDPKLLSIVNHCKSAQTILIKTLSVLGEGSLTENMNEIRDDKVDIYPVKPEDLAAILYTSGTTGKPKGAMISHRALLCNAQDLVTAWQITANDVFLHVLPLFHTHGLFFNLNTALLVGAQIILLPKFDLDLFFNYLPQATVIMGVPTHYYRLLQDSRLTEENCQHLRLFICGSAPLAPSTFKAFQNKTRHIILERYGMTETGINTSNPVHGIRKIGSVGLPLPSTHVRVVDEEIQIKGNNLFSGYWRQLKKTKESFTEDGYFKTGDLGKWDDEGYLTIMGRSKDLIITGGLNVYPKEIELTLDHINGILESAVIGIPHPEFGEAVIAVIVSNQNQLTEEAIITELKQHHATYKCPKKIFFQDNLPKNAMGKIQKNVLKEKYSNCFY